MIFAETDVGNVVQLIETWRDVSSPLPLPRRKAHINVVRKPENVTTILLHQTAVLGGFGITARHLAEIPESGEREDYRRMLARFRRYRNTPYHAIFSPQDHASLIQWPAWAYTYHGNGGNRYSLGWAYDGLFAPRRESDELDADGARESLRHLLESAREQGCEIRHIEAHRQHSNCRLGDPGAKIWHEVALPIAREFGLTMTDRVTGSGQPIPDSWL